MNFYKENRTVVEDQLTVAVCSHMSICYNYLMQRPRVTIKREKKYVTQQVSTLAVPSSGVRNLLKLLQVYGTLFQSPKLYKYFRLIVMLQSTHLDTVQQIKINNFYCLSSLYYWQLLNYTYMLILHRRVERAFQCGI
jgi:hypothetical protein